MAALLQSGRGEPLDCTDSQQGCCVAGALLASCSPLACPPILSRVAKMARGTHHGIHSWGAVTDHQEDRTPAKKHTQVVLSLPPSPDLPWAAFCVSGRVRQLSMWKWFGLYSRHLKDTPNLALAADLVTCSDFLPENLFLLPAGSKPALASALIPSLLYKKLMWVSASKSHAYHTPDPWAPTFGSVHPIPNKLSEEQSLLCITISSWARKDLTTYVAKVGAQAKARWSVSHSHSCSIFLEVFIFWLVF